MLGEFKNDSASSANQRGDGQPSGMLWNSDALHEKKSVSSLLTPSNRQLSIDQKFESGTTIDCNIQNYFFQRLAAKEVTFNHVDFSFTIFETCYLRNCVFQNCNFTGCRFIASNFYGSSFVGCKFDYAIFERTIVTPEILDVGCPAFENLKQKFARTLRANFQSLGDAEAVNRAIEVELNATQEHLKKAWSSGESYYRAKYSRWVRAHMFLKWFKFKTLDFVWGNGESLLKLGRAIVFILLSMAIIDVIILGKNGFNLSNYFASLAQALVVFLGIKAPSQYSELYLSIVLVVRLVLVGFLLSIIIKRYNRR